MSRRQRTEDRGRAGFFSLFFIFCSLFSVCYAQAISSVELINKARDYDGKTVVYQGEVIGDVMARGEYAWININDGRNAIGIWIRKDLAKSIIYTGAYKTRGDQVEVIGIFQRSCAVHGGDLDLHAESMRRIKDGNNLEEKLSSRRMALAFILGAIVLLLWISKSFGRQQKQK